MGWKDWPGWLKGGIVLSMVVCIFNTLSYFLIMKGTISSAGEASSYSLLGLYMIFILSFILGLVSGIIYGTKSLLKRSFFTRGLFLGLFLTLGGFYLGSSWNLLIYSILTKVFSVQTVIFALAILSYIIAMLINFLFGIIFSYIDEKLKIISL